jgi:phage terminase large subunit-like protein
LQSFEQANLVIGGLDLASVSDLCSLVLMATMPNGKKRIWCKHYLPEDRALDQHNKNAALYKRWSDQGWLTLTSGNVTDYSYIERDVLALKDSLNIKEIAFDKYNATQIVNNLQAEDVEMVEFRQGFLSMSPAMKQLEIDILTGNIEHPNDPVMNWAMSNVVMVRDAAGNQKPDKEKSIGKIDPVVALIMAAGRTALFQDDIPSSITVF